MVYLVDMENVALRWASYLQTATAEDEFLLFYSKNTTCSLPFPIIQILFDSKAKIRCIPCYVGENAMDFQLCSELGFCIAGDKTAKYAIVSEDTGYDPVVKHWQDKGVFVERIVPGGHAQEIIEAMTPDATKAALKSMKEKSTAKPAEPEAAEPQRPPSAKPAEEITYNGKPISAHFLKILKEGKTGVPVPSLQAISQMMELSMKEPESKRLDFVKQRMSQKFGGLTSKYWRKLESVLRYALSGQSKKALSEEYLKLLHAANSGIAEGILKDVAGIMADSRTLPKNKRMYNVYSELFRKYKKPGQTCYQKLKKTIETGMAA